MNKYITIVEVEKKPKTSVWDVINTRTKEICGQIRWYGGFRKYVFFPTDGFLFDASCLTLITLHLENVNKRK